MMYRMSVSVWQSQTSYAGKLEAKAIFKWMFSLSPALMLLPPKSVKRSRQLLVIDGRVDHRGRKVEYLKLKTWTNSSSSTYMTFFEFIQFLSYGASSSRQRKIKQANLRYMNFILTKSRSNENEHKVFTHHSLQQNHPMTLMQSVFSTMYVYIDDTWFTFCSDDLFTCVKKRILRFES